MSTNLSQLIHKIDNKLNMPSNQMFYNTDTNFYSNKVKEGLPFFSKHQNYKNDVLFSPIPISNTSTLITTENDIRKTIEREMTPYLSRMKSELNLIVEKFKNEYNDQNLNNEKINKLIDDNELLKKQIETNIKVNEEKFLDNYQMLKTYDNKYDEIKNKIKTLDRGYILLTENYENLSKYNM